MQTALKLAKYLKPYWLWAVLAPLLMLLEVCMDLMQPRLVQRIIDEGIANLDMAIVTHTGALMIIVALIGAVGGVGCTIFTVIASQHFGADLRGDLFRKVQALSFGNLDELETGQTITRLTNDVTQVQEIVSMMLRIMVRAPLMMAGSLIMAILTSPRLALAFLALIPLVAAIVYWITRKAYPLFSEVQSRLDDLNTVMQENLAGVRVVKAFVRAAHEIKRFGKANNALMERTIYAARTVALSFPLMTLAVNMGVVTVIWFGGVRITRGEMQTGELIAFVNYLTQALMSLMFVSMLMMRMARAGASAARIDELMIAEPQLKSPRQSHGEFTPQGRIAFENVTFSYHAEKHDPVLKNISFIAEPGETVAILGATGSGKSSLIHLIPRFYDATEGRVTLDGVDVRELDENLLRRNIGIAMQESVLFSGTIRDNIRYGRPDASEEEVVAAARAAQAHEFIEGFPNGYDSVVGQRGVNLSGGQKQRIAIARALITRPTVLILDDSTSSVDVETESRIEEELENLMKAKGDQPASHSTRIIVAQRISTVLNAHKIIVLDNGEIAGQGAHRELLETCPIYREIYQSQLGDGGTANGKG
ncbi:ABC transporter ATP-binding protein [Candidatus Sumerlaeota bacterium]|nr:ABC transporter ATP-binding protein [Candidatus Sumerlaeota bacterium]